MAPKPKTAFVRLPESLVERLVRHCEARGHDLENWCLYAIDDRLDFELSIGATYGQDEIHCTR